MTLLDTDTLIDGFEEEVMIMPAQAGPHVSRFVAADDLSRLPCLVMEYSHGQTLARRMEQQWSLWIGFAAGL